MGHRRHDPGRWRLEVVRTASAGASAEKHSDFSNEGKKAMSATKPKILVLGATGQVGGAAVRHLAGNPDVEVVVATRSPEKWKTPGATAVRPRPRPGPRRWPRHWTGIERALLVTGYTVDMLRQGKEFLNAAKRAGVKHVVHLGACGDDDTRVDHYAWHQFIERYVEWWRVLLHPPAARDFHAEPTRVRRRTLR